MSRFLIILALLLKTPFCFADEVAARYVGIWGLSGFMKDGELRAPASIHFLFITAEGEMTKVKELQNYSWKNAPKQKIAIDDKGKMSTVARDGSSVALGTVTLSGGKMHLVAAGEEHHLVYYPIKQEK